MVIPLDREQAAQWVSDCLSGKIGGSVEFQIARPNGDVRIPRVPPLPPRHQPRALDALVDPGAHVLELLRPAAGPFDHRALRRVPASQAERDRQLGLRQVTRSASSPSSIAFHRGVETRTTAPMASRFDFVPARRRRSDRWPGATSLR